MDIDVQLENKEFIGIKTVAGKKTLEFENGIYIPLVKED